MQAEAESGKRAMPIFQYRFGHGLQKLKYLMQQGISGPGLFYHGGDGLETPRRILCSAVARKMGDRAGWPIVTLAIHAHDALYYILGPAKNVFARTATLVNPIETDDTISASLEMADGSLASLSVTTGCAQEISRHRFCFKAVHCRKQHRTLPQHLGSVDLYWRFAGIDAADRGGLGGL